ncbi:MAG: holo-ACP synthase [Enterobacteriaceae bacterium]|jgi:holo-[acyl-carrier protein] synthase|nr:holo-ACP synthase [Enterobacteriaceae bacterium]
MRIGTDIVEVDRIKRLISDLGMAFLQRVFTDQEIDQIDAQNPDYERASGFWAAKESMVKAIGLGFRNGIRFHDMDIHHDEYGCPHFIFSGQLKEVITEMDISDISMSISHCRTHAIAVVAMTSKNS